MGFYPPASLVRDAQRRGVEVRPPDVNRSAAEGAHRGRSRARRADVRPLAGGGGGEGGRGGARAGRPFRDVRELAQRTELDRDALEALVASGACDCFGAAAPTRAALGARPRAAGADRAGLGRRGAAARAAARSDGGDARRCASRRRGSGCSPTTARRASRSACTRWSCCGRTCRSGVLSSARAASGAATAGASRGRDGGRAAAPVDGEGRRLHAARGRARPDEPDRPAAGVRALPRARARRAAAARARPLRAASTGT